VLSNKWQAISIFAATLTWFTVTVSAQETKRPFTIADDIGLTLFQLPGGSDPEVHFSPDGKYLAVWTETAHLDMNCVEDSLRFYRSSEIEAFLENSGSQPLKPTWTLNLSGRQWPIIHKWRWLADSSGAAFLRYTYGADRFTEQIALADLQKKTIEPLTALTEEVRGFDIRDRQHFVYYTANHDDWRKKRQADLQSEASVGTGVDWHVLFFPDDPVIQGYAAPSTRELWAVIDGKRFQVKHGGLTPDFQQEFMALSPDGRSLATVARVDEVPKSWETLYPPPQLLTYGDWHPQHPIQAGHGTANQYVRLDLESGSAESLTDSPFVDAVGMMATPGYIPVWSSDGQTILLPGTFLKPKAGEQGRPCVALVNLVPRTTDCVARLRVGYGEDTEPTDNYHLPSDVVAATKFSSDDKSNILVTFASADESPGRTMHYRRRADGTWQTIGETIGQGETSSSGLEVKVKESFSEPPLLIVSKEKMSRVLWDPNPQLKNIELSQVSIYKWKDLEGRDWEGGLYKPTHFQPGKRYPLVIQTHGFVKSVFSPAGFFSTALAAQELAAQGIMVLQAAYSDRECEMDTPNEAPCSVGLIESAAKQLISDGLVDAEKIGVVGFSRTCYYVMEMLTTNSLHLKAASITDGVMADYVSWALFSNDEFEKMIGAKPVGEGLQQWLKRSPSFNLDKVNTPLLVNALSGRAGALTMWSPYAELHYLKKPVDLMVFKAQEHILTNPAARLASQGGSVDWFRFWLQDYEDPDPAKAEQYKRWRGLRELQVENEKNSTAAQVSSH